MSAIVIWFIVGAALMLGELLTPGFILFFLGVGAWAASLTALIFPGIEQEIAVFLIVSVASLLILRRKLVSVFMGKQTVQLEPVGFPHKGRQAKVLEDISPEIDGTIALGGSYWKATAISHIAKGSTVKVIEQVEGNELLILVEKI